MTKSNHDNCYLNPVNFVLPANETVANATLTEASGLQAKLAALPTGLTGLDRWVAHRHKVPVDCHTGKTGDVTDPATWASYDVAKCYTDANPDTGLGFVLAGDGIVGIDIDHCFVNGVAVDVRIQQILDRLHSYTEISPSGTGIHIYVYGMWPEAARKKIKLDGGIAIEVYTRDRYFTVTGNRFGDANEVIQDQDILDYLYEEFFNGESSGSGFKSELLKLNIVEIPPIVMDRIVKRNAESAVFAGLWSGEDRSGDESSDDMRLLCRLLPICEFNPDITAATFLASPFVQSKDEAHQKKLQRPDYLERSIARAMDYAACNSEDVNAVSDLELLNSYEFNDFGNAQRLLSRYEGKVLYDACSANWLLYEEGRWRPDNKRKDGMLKIANDLYRFLTDALQHWSSDIDFEEDAQEESEEDEEAVAAARAKQHEYNLLKKAVCRLGDTARQKAMIRNAEAEKSAGRIDFNCWNNLLVVKNGTVDLRTGNLLPHSPVYHITMRTNVNYDSAAQEPKRFIQFLNEIFDHNAELIAYVQRLLGYCITGESREHVFHVLHGEGANGKSVLINLLCRMFSEYCKNVSAGALEWRSDNDRPNPSLLQAKDARIIIVNETNAGIKLNSALIKQISAGDEICPRALFKDNEHFTPHMQILWVTNHIPQIDWEDGGLRRRYKLIPFTVTFAPDQQDRDLPEKLWAEREGILKWLVQGAIDWYAHGLGEQPDTMADALEQERRNEDSVYAFFKEGVILTGSAKDRIPASEVYQAYLRYCLDNEIDDPVSVSTFGTKLPKLGVTKKKTPGCNVYVGIQLREPAV